MRSIERDGGKFKKKKLLHSYIRVLILKEIYR